MLALEAQNGYFVFYDKDGNEVSSQMSAEEAIANIWNIHAEARR